MNEILHEIAAELKRFDAADDWISRAVHLNMALQYAAGLGANLPERLREQLVAAERKLLAQTPPIG